MTKKFREASKKTASAMGGAATTSGGAGGTVALTTENKRRAGTSPGSCPPLERDLISGAKRLL